MLSSKETINICFLAANKVEWRERRNSRKWHFIVFDDFNRPLHDKEFQKINKFDFCESNDCRTKQSAGIEDESIIQFHNETMKLMESITVIPGSVLSWSIRQTSNVFEIRKSISNRLCQCFAFQCVCDFRMVWQVKTKERQAERERKRIAVR